MELRKSSGNSENPLYRLSEEIHTVIAATIDEEGLPVTCAIDIMDRDSDSLYFLTARGKGFYHRLKARPFIALTGIKGNNTMSSIAISIRGKTEDAGDDILQHLLEKNSYMYEIYPTEESRKALVAFRIHEGSGELFDLSTKPITRKAFSFGMKEKTEELFITESCTGCRKCIEACPQSCIITNTLPFSIKTDNCLFCGRCEEVCPEKAVVRRKS